MDFNARFIPGNANPAPSADAAPDVSKPVTIEGLLEQFSNTPNTVPRELIAPCVQASSTVLTMKGPKRADALQVDDTVLTRDHGPRRVVSTHTTSQTEGYAPSILHIQPETIGNSSALTVLSDQSLVVQHWSTELAVGQYDILICAQDLIGRTGVSVMEPEPFDQTFVVLDSHALINVDGLWTEALHPDDIALERFGRLTRRHMRNEIPKLRDYSPRATLCLSPEEAQVVLDQIFTPSRPDKSVKNCHATRPERDPRVACHSIASATNLSESTDTPYAAQ